jgi:hypothetical protein
MWGPQQAPQNNSMVTFVNDESMAVNYPVNPGFTVAVINASDPENMKMYLKSTQINGMPNPTRIFALQDITPKQQGGDTVSRQEYDAMSKELAEMKALLAGIVKGGNGK